MKPTKTLQEESGKVIQEKSSSASAPASASASATTSATASATEPNPQLPTPIIEPMPPVSENGMFHVKMSTEQPSAGSGNDPLGAGMMGNLSNHNSGGDDDAGLF